MKPCPWPSLIRFSLSLLPLPASEAILRTGRTACHANRPFVGHSSVAVSACMAAFALDARRIPRHSAASAPAPGVNRTPLIVGGKAAITLFSHRFFKIDYIIVQRSLQAHYGLRPQCRPRLSARILWAVFDIGSRSSLWICAFGSIAKASAADLDPLRSFFNQTRVILLEAASKNPASATFDESGMRQRIVFQGPH